MTQNIRVGVLALQGAFQEHLQLLRQAAAFIGPDNDSRWEFLEVRTAGELSQCDALIIPGGESTTMSLVAARSDLLEPLRDFVKYVEPMHNSAEANPNDFVQDTTQTHLGHLRWLDPSCGVC